MNLLEMDIHDSFDFFCPKTGKMILGPDYFEVSDATAFCFSPDAGDFESIADEYQPLWEKLRSSTEMCNTAASSSSGFVPPYSTSIRIS